MNIGTHDPGQFKPLQILSDTRITVGLLWMLASYISVVLASKIWVVGRMLDEVCGQRSPTDIAKMLAVIHFDRSVATLGP